MKSLWCLCLFVAAGMASVRAAVYIDIQQHNSADGAYVVFSVSGSMTVDGANITNFGSDSLPGTVYSGNAQLIMGTSNSSDVSYDGYHIADVQYFQSSFGTGGVVHADAETTVFNDAFGFDGNAGYGEVTFLVPSGYETGSELNGSMIMYNQTLSSLGLTPSPPGGYTWLWSIGDDPDPDDFVTINILPTVPEPSTAVLVVAAGLAVWIRRRRA